MQNESIGTGTTSPAVAGAAAPTDANKGTGDTALSPAEQGAAAMRAEFDRKKHGENLRGGEDAGYCSQMPGRGIAQGSLVQRELSAKLTEGLLYRSINMRTNPTEISSDVVPYSKSICNSFFEKI